MNQNTTGNQLLQEVMLKCIIFVKKPKPWLVSEPVPGTGRQIVRTYLTKFSCALHKTSVEVCEAKT